MLLYKRKRSYNNRACFLLINLARGHDFQHEEDFRLKSGGFYVKWTYDVSESEPCLFGSIFLKMDDRALT